MALLYDPNADADSRQTLREVRRVALEDRNLVDVVCPHPGCEETVSATAPDSDMEITVTRSAALFGDYEKVRCPDGHKVFVHHCEIL